MNKCNRRDFPLRDHKFLVHCNDSALLSPLLFAIVSANKRNKPYRQMDRHAADSNITPPPSPQPVSTDGYLWVRG
ncbi:hypothetical protein J6590_050751 [Homalodisca vitripennis]|nr:hypothetical protein J6590_050751 [Homalodisca vitripennis]